MKLLFGVYLLLVCISTSAQVKDTVKNQKRNYESLFADDDTLTQNDYLLSIERMFQALNKTSLTAEPLPAINAMNERMDEDDTVISIIKQRLNPNSSRGLNIRNVQMFTVLLGQIYKDTKVFASKLHGYDTTLDSIKRQIFDLRKDTVIRHIFRDSLLRASFKAQLQQLRGKWKKADSLIRFMNVLIDNTLARTSDNLISTGELQLQAVNTAQITAARAFRKERNYLWEQNRPKMKNSFSKQFKNTVASEKKITRYYFSHTHNQLLLLLLSGLVFFFWIFFNFRSIKKRKQLDLLQPFHFSYINVFPFFASLIFMLNLAPLFDLDAPIVYVELIEFLLMITLTVYFWKSLSRNLFFFWIFFIILFLLQAFSRYLGLPFYLNRWLSFILNSTSFILGVFAFLKFKKHYTDQKALFLTGALFTFFNLLAILCNLFGRVTLMQIFSLTATYSFIQTVGLLVFVEAITEAFLLQIQSSRVRKDYKQSFDHAGIAKGISRAIIFFAIIIWLIVFTTNLNVYQFLSFKIIIVR